ncbi:MAG: YvcK family protein [Candidatus Dojkabacteria bacterium]|nr:YvcK family protein [Candidatus Dojkabacteria bacterium]
MNIVVIGGGTGSSNVLVGLKNYKDLNISVIVGTMDDGGSNAMIKDELGLLPLSDIRKSIIALAQDSDKGLIRELFTYRFSEGNGIKGHTLGNLLMIAMTDITGSEVSAIDAFKFLFEISGNILPVTTDDAKLVAKYDDGTTVEGEHLIDEPKSDKHIIDLSLDSKTKAYPPTIDTIKDANYIIIGPGDLYTTTLAVLIVPGISETIKESNAKIIFIPNLMSKIGQTRGLTQRDMVEILEKQIGRSIDYILMNNGEIPKNALKRYLDQGEHQFKDDLEENSKRKIIKADLIANSLVKKDKGDELVRSLVRHDPEKLGSELYKIFRNQGVSRVFRWIINVYR